MPAQKRLSSENANADRPPSSKQPRRDSEEDKEEEPRPEVEEEAEHGDGDGDDDDDQREEQQTARDGDGDGDGEDSDDSAADSSLEEKSEYVLVKLSDVRKDVQCPICLGIIRKTRTVMECLHRFCRECIDKSMRLGNNECPTCRTHCASRRSLRDDPNFDALIEALYPDIDKYEEEELALHEEEKNRNKQIQDSIAQILQRQSEALTKRRTTGKDLAGGLATRLHRNLRSAHSRRRRNPQGSNNQGSEENEDENDSHGVKDSGSADERGTEVRQKRRKRKRGPRQRQPSSSAEGECVENDVEANRVGRVSPGIVWNTEMLAWGRGGVRSHNRHGATNGLSKHARNNRISKLVEHLRNLEENNELDIHVLLIPLDKQHPLKQPYVCCRPKLPIKHLCGYIAHQTSLQAEEVEVLVIEEQSNLIKHLSIHTLSGEYGQDVVFDVHHVHVSDMQLLKSEDTLDEVVANHRVTEKYLILGYRQKNLTVS